MTPATVPDAPTIGTATGGNAQATVTFTAPASNGGAAITGYTVTSLPAGGVDSNAGTTGLSHVMTGLTNGTAYTFTVTATNAKGTSVASAASNSVTAATVPDAPTIGSATGGNASATVTFIAPANNGGSAITAYTVTSSPGGLTGTGTTSPIVITGLTNGIAYSFTGTATNAAGTSVASAASNSVTPAIPNVLYIHADQLDTPRVITDTNGNVVWQWDNSDPFGNNLPNENPNNAGTFNFNLRFAGQYFDRETNTHYNYFRDAYDPALGRYTQSDPIGLSGGINTYTYVGENPISRVDPIGLAWYRPWRDQSTPYVAGRQTTPGFRPGGFISKAIEHCVPAGRTFAEIHDEKVDLLISQGVSDGWANIPTMPEAYVEAVQKESYYSAMDFYRGLLSFFDIRGLYGQ